MVCAGMTLPNLGNLRDAGVFGIPPSIDILGRNDASQD
jgi:hypothetical protein